MSGWTPTGLEARLRHFRRLWRSDSSKGRWLDAGCGGGAYTRLLAGWGMSVVAVDYSAPTLLMAEAANGGLADWVVADLRQLPTRSQSFDGALCLGLTQTAADSAWLVRTLSEAVRPGGQIWIDGLNAWCIANFALRCLHLFHQDDLEVRFERPGRLLRLVRSVGLKDVHLTWLPILPHWLQFLTRFAESAFARRVLAVAPPLAFLSCHSFIVHARVPAEGAETPLLR